MSKYLNSKYDLPRDKLAARRTFLQVTDKDKNHFDDHLIFYLITYIVYKYYNLYFMSYIIWLRNFLKISWLILPFLFFDFFQFSYLPLLWLLFLIFYYLLCSLFYDIEFLFILWFLNVFFFQIFQIALKCKWSTLPLSISRSYRFNFRFLSQYRIFSGVIIFISLYTWIHTENLMNFPLILFV